MVCSLVLDVIESEFESRYLLIFNSFFYNFLNTYLNVGGSAQGVQDSICDVLRLQAGHSIKVFLRGKRGLHQSGADALQIRYNTFIIN